MYILIRLVKLVFIVGLIYVLYRVLWKGEKLFKGKTAPHPQNAIEEMKKDPVCGTYIPVNQALKLKSGKDTLYFCSDSCKIKFQEMPQEKTKS